MFESTTMTDRRTIGAADGVESPLRRPFAWAELVARLAATRDARSVLADVAYQRGGSFLVADGLLGEAWCEAAGKCESVVNPVGLTDGKAGGALCAEAAADAAPVDREAQ